MHTSREECVEEEDEACFWEECEESTNVCVWGEKKAKTERQHDIAIFSASCVVTSLLFYSDDDDPSSAPSTLNLNSGKNK